jgi:orotate phosphoribosyltransferase
MLDKAPVVFNARERLRQLLQSDAILYRSETQEILDRRGKPMDWIFYSWGISLTHEGSSLAAACLLELLSGFESLQVAGIGMTGLPLTSSIVSIGLGKYSALYVRPSREVWGTRRRVEGVGDKSRPVVVVDDCICGGASLKSACAALEYEGYQVEGAVCLVNFRWKGGVEWARALGYRVETVFDVWTDQEMSDARPVYGHADVGANFSANCPTPDGLSPADAARWIAVKYLSDGTVSAPPQTLDSIYDASGGIMVSFRDRKTDYRVARDGFYHVNDAEANLCQDLVLATIKTLRSSRGEVAAYGIDRLKVGVTVYGRQVPATLRDLDFSRFSILVKSTMQPKLAGALPNTQFFVSEIQQLRHARFTNARLLPLEPHDLFVSSVRKSIETGCEWPPFGTSEEPERFGDEAVGALLTARARTVLEAAMNGCEVVPAGALNFAVSERIDGVAVGLYHRGLFGCWTSWQGDPDNMIREATIGALNDKRWPRRAGLSGKEIDIVVSIMRLAETLGPVSVERAAFVLRLGKDTLGVRKDEKHSILLSYIPCHNNWSKIEMARKVLEKAGISEFPLEWITYFTRSWLNRSGHVWLLEGGFPRRQAQIAEASETQIIRVMASYIADKVGESGLPDYCYYPTSDRAIVAQSAPRVVLALSALNEAAISLADLGLRDIAIAGLRRCVECINDTSGLAELVLPGVPCGVMAEVFLLNAVFRSRDQTLIAMPALQSLLKRFRTFFHSDGAITWLREGRRIDSEHDLFPGAALHMIANVAEVEGPETLPPVLEEHLAWYRHRFRVKPNWGMVFWQTQGWVAIHRVTSGRLGADFAYELVEWALDRQLAKNGAFLVDYAPDGPGFHTSCVLEALADAWGLARLRGDGEHERRYRDAWERGRAFLDRLIIRDEDTFPMRRPDRAMGGVRRSLNSSSVRIDHVAHTLLALVKRPAEKMRIA